MYTRTHILSKFSPVHAAWWFAALIGVLLLLVPPSAAAAETSYPHRKHPAEVVDHRFHHDRSYPARGVFVRELPAAAVPVRYHETPYYFHGGSWYRPYGGGGFRVIAPPLGMRIRFLPNYYTTVWFGGIPYYYANSVYYQWLPDQREYVVTTPPDEAALSTRAPDASTADEPFIYPKNGQSEQQQANDRYECHTWASNQSGYDPTHPAGSLALDQLTSVRGGYFRAMTACLESRGYSVK